MRQALIVAAAVVLVGVALALSGALYVVDETQQVVITQFGSPIGEPERAPNLCRFTTSRKKRGKVTFFSGF